MLNIETKGNKNEKDIFGSEMKVFWMKFHR